MNGFCAVAIRENAFLRFVTFPAFAIRTNRADTGFIAAQDALIPIYILIKNNSRHAVLPILLM